MSVVRVHDQGRGVFEVPNIRGQTFRAALKKVGVTMAKAGKVTVRGKKVKDLDQRVEDKAEVVYTPPIKNG